MGPLTDARPSMGGRTAVEWLLNGALPVRALMEQQRWWVFYPRQPRRAEHQRSARFLNAQQ
jgi:hypothetical protein